MTSSMFSAGLEAAIFSLPTTLKNTPRLPSVYKGAVFGQPSPKQARSVCDSAALRTHTCPRCTSAAPCTGPLSLLGAVRRTLGLFFFFFFFVTAPWKIPPRLPRLAFGCALLHIIRKKLAPALKQGRSRGRQWTMSSRGIDLLKKKENLFRLCFCSLNFIEMQRPRRRSFRRLNWNVKSEGSLQSFPARV